MILGCCDCVVHIFLLKINISNLYIYANRTYIGTTYLLQILIIYNNKSIIHWFWYQFRIYFNKQHFEMEHRSTFIY